MTTVYFHTLYGDHSSFNIICEYFKVIGKNNVCLSIISPSGEFKKVYNAADHYGLRIIEKCENTDMGLFEHPAFRIMYKNIPSYSDNDTVFYLQGKGTGNNTDYNQKIRGYLLKQMSDYLSGKKKINNGDGAAGCLWMIDKVNNRSYFAGNHWVAKAGWLKTLKPYNEFELEYDHDRFICEFWINSNNNLVPVIIDKKVFIYPNTFNLYTKFVNELPLI
jgi:hypothetical protein